MPAGDFFVLAYAAIGWGLFVSDGMYDQSAFLLMLGALVLLALGMTRVRYARKDRKAEPSTVILLGALLLFLVLNIESFSPVMYLRWPAYESTFKNLCRLLLALLPLLCLPGRRFTMVRHAVFLCIGAAAFAFRLLVPFASPAPTVDVYSMSQQSSRHLLEGRNPYVATIRDVYEGKGRRTYGYVIRHYTYPPASLYPQAASFALGGDVRYAFVAAEALFLFVLWRVARKRWPLLSIDLLLLLFLFHPRGLFVLEHGWTEPLLLGSFALFVYLWDRSKRLSALVTYGYFLAIKQYTVFFTLPLLILVRRRSRLAVVVLAALATFLPFAFWHWRSLWEQGILFQFLAPYRPDALSLGNFLRPWVGERSMVWSSVTALIAMVGTSYLFRKEQLSGFLQACTLTFAATLVLGSWAFANYYYFLSGMILLTAVSVCRETKAAA